MPLRTVALSALMLAASNVFMTFAWYAHLKKARLPLGGALHHGRGVLRVPRLA
jgi:uncharacterized protein (DUF486 family)